MFRIRLTVFACTLGLAGPLYAEGWVNFSNETSTRLSSALNDPALAANDPEEKDYAWGDVDNDGDIDLVVVRKQPFTSTGKRVNVLFMNEGTAEGHAKNGIFVDHTALYVSASDVGGDQGFLTATNDRDVQLADLDNDGWLDMVTAPTLTDNQAKHLSHPRIYKNLGESGGTWQGFEYQDARIPQMHPNAGPRFCSVSAGDVTGDGYADLYFGDYDSGGSQIFDYNNRLLINAAASNPGFFTDETSSRLTSAMSEAAFGGTASIIVDVNDDGYNDVVKQTSLNSPTHVAVTYNNPSNEGFFNGYDTIYALAPYFVTEGDLNQDGRLDLVIVDDGTDRYMLNQGNGGDGQANWTEFSFANSNGFGGNAIVRDLNNDGHQDVIITDVDVDIPGCNRRTLIYRNLGNVPNVSFQEQGEVIPNGALLGVHDIAIFDIDGNGWLDAIVGRCDGTQIYMNTPPAGLVFTYPNGVPTQVEPGVETSFEVAVSAFGAALPEPGTGQLWLASGVTQFSPVPMEEIGEDLYRATLPVLECTERIRFFVSADADNGDQFNDPPSAPGSYFSVFSALGLEIVLRDDLEDDVTAWSTINDGAGSGAWEIADPNGTISGGGLAAPEDDATAGAENLLCFVTDNGDPGEGAGISDVDGGPVHLISPRIELAGADANISYSQWFFCEDVGTSGADFLTIWVSNDDGDTWVEATGARVDTTNHTWESGSFVVGAYIEPTDFVRVRFSTDDEPNDSITEAAIDNFQVEVLLCDDGSCTSDIDGSGDIGLPDLLAVLAAWGDCVGCPEDIDGDGEAGLNDLLAVLSTWGPCP